MIKINRTSPLKIFDLLTGYNNIVKRGNIDFQTNYSSVLFPSLHNDVGNPFSEIKYFERRIRID